MDIFDYIFYRVASFYKKRKDLSPETAASMIVALMQFFLILDLFALFRVFYEYDFPNGFNKFWALPVIASIGVINWFRYEKGNLYPKLRKKWKDEDDNQKRKRGKLIVMGIVLVLSIPVLYGLIRHNIMEGKNFFE
ncbi:hypothetical protein SAMN05421740_11511 [Parapedobacter koreensis]|uniref:Uncharacterized protein n=1 Tax=Parapedobacter koreensis TaxID=332977 RepID=A0A1H7UDF9_9SPHI|nr:hypothetical protein SAMN05421740_11511 [Parapedobacter koreensis]